MAFTVESDGKGKKKQPSPDMNVTPLIDVVLVLLIIFMAMTPLAAQRFWVHTPKQEKKEVEETEQTQDPNPPLVLKVGSDQGILVNGAVVEKAELRDRLRRMFAAREDHVLFFDAADDVPFGFALEVMDQARAGGAVTIATLTTAIGGGSQGVAQ